MVHHFFKDNDGLVNRDLTFAASSSSASVMASSSGRRHLEASGPHTAMSVSSTADPRPAMSTADPREPRPARSVPPQTMVDHGGFHLPRGFQGLVSFKDSDVISAHLADSFEVEVGTFRRENKHKCGKFEVFTGGIPSENWGDSRWHDEEFYNDFSNC